MYAPLVIVPGGWWFSVQATDVLVEVKGQVGWITIDREQKRNALNVGVMRGLLDGFARMKTNDAVRAVVLTGAGDKAFCAGGDLGGFTGDESKVEQHHARGILVDLFEDMTRLGKPIVARVNGHALAGGFGLMSACDLIVATDDATFGMPEIRSGLWPHIITAVVRRWIPERKVLELMMTGERIDAAEALRWGMVNTVVARGELDAAVEELCAKLTSTSPAIMRLGKDSFYASRDMGFREGMEYLHGQLAVNLDTEDVVEGVTAFLEKREPNWTGR